ncbi:MAG: ABC transporter substrate-binding protein, partial [Acidimicrobiales bacterium]
RRTFLGAGALGAAAAALAACGGGGSPASTSTSGGPGAKLTSGPPGPGPFSGGSYGGAVTVGWLSEANSFDPATGENDQGWDAVSCLLTTPPYMFATDYGDLQPALAVGQPQISSDGLRYTIKLRPDVRFSTGQPITAADYVYAWTRVLDPKLASWASSYLYPIVGAQEVANGKAKTVSGLKALDPTTLQVELTAPTFTFVNYLAQPFMAPLPQATVESLGKAFNTRPVSTGPFVVESYSSADQKASFVRNPRYAWKGLPYLDGVRFTWGINENLALLQLEQGVIDIVGDGFGTDVMPQVEASGSLRRYLVQVPENAMAWVGLDNAKPELADPRVRQALNWASDRQALALVTHGEFIASGYPLPSTLTAFHHSAKPFGYDPGRARALLSAAGASNLRLSFLTDGSPPWPNVAQLLQQQWKAVGVTLDIQTVSNSAWLSETSTAPLKIDSFQNDYYMVEPSGLDLIIPNYETGGSYNTVGYSNKTIDALIGKAQTQATLAASNVYVSQIEEQLVADPPSVFLFDITFPAGRSTKLHNFQYQGYFGPRYERMWL